MAIADRKAGKLATYGLLDYYVRIETSDRQVRKLPLSPKGVCTELDISMQQFRRAIATARVEHADSSSAFPLAKIRENSDLSSSIIYTHIDYCFGSAKK